MTGMPWWGWGQAGIAFSDADKPDFRPFLESKLGVSVSEDLDRPVDFASLTIPEPHLPGPLREALDAAVGADRVSTDARDRLVHARGKSLRDLICQRRGELGRLPDAVVRPGDEAEVQALIAAALAHDAVLIAFGGGSSISGSLEAPTQEARPVLSIDLERMKRVLAIDPAARLAQIEAGAFGPDLERQLEERGWTLGHFPDSFAHSTLGGWVATRSSGMQSDKYGDVADLTRAVRVATPTGMLVTRPVPSQSTGPSVREMILGSEGRLGVITEATVQVHRRPATRSILGYLFPTWADGLATMQALAASEATPSVTRVSDAAETAFSFATRKASSPVDRMKSAALQVFLKRRKGFDVSKMCLSFIGFEGSERHVAEQRRLVGRVVAEHGGVCVGAGPGVLYDQKKFDTPYIRDYLLDRGIVGDVSETAAPWSALANVHAAVNAAAQDAFTDLGVRGYAMCHMSHSYHAGACLYFTFALRPTRRASALADYDRVKSSVQQAFVDHGGTLSHHHAVGTEHAPWLEQDISAPGVAMVRALFDGVDPGKHFNPGKILPTDRAR